LPWLESEFRAVAAVQTNAEWGSMEGAPEDFPPGPHQHDWADILNEPSSYPPSAHGHVEADITDLDRMRWKGVWAAGAYAKNDVVRERTWLVVASADTTAEPVPELVPEWGIDPEPTWGGANTAGVFGARVADLTLDVVVFAVRIKARQSGPFDVWIVKDGIRVDLAIGLDLAADVWREFHVAPFVMPAGGVLDIVASGGSYNEAVDYWLPNTNIKGFRGATYPPTAGQINENAYGVDLSYAPVVLGTGWKVLSWAV
jgi:hypothetical protein